MDRTESAYHYNSLLKAINDDDWDMAELVGMGLEQHGLARSQIEASFGEEFAWMTRTPIYRMATKNLRDKKTRSTGKSRF